MVVIPGFGGGEAGPVWWEVGGVGQNCAAELFRGTFPRSCSAELFRGTEQFCGTVLFRRKEQLQLKAIQNRKNFFQDMLLVNKR